MRQFIDVTGKTEDEAISRALEQLGLDRDDVSVEILERAKAGFLGLGSCPAKVRVSYGPEEEPASQQPRAEKVREERVEKPRAPRPEKKTVEKPAEKPQHREEPKQEPVQSVKTEELGEEVNDTTASLVVAQLLYLEAQDPDKDIQFYINSPGGSVTAGMAIYDTMQYIKCDVSTICIGMAASMGAFLLSSGTKGKRLALPNAEIMIHQPSAGTQGQITDMAIHLKRLEIVKTRLTGILAANTGKPLDVVRADCERDNFMTAQEAMEYGLIDKVIDHR